MLFGLQEASDEILWYYPDFGQGESIPIVGDRVDEPLGDGIFQAIEKDARTGTKTHFVFVYAGHGNIGPNQEGYLNLPDHRFRQTDLYEEVVSKSPATFNHLILDACHAYFVVNKSGGKPDKEGDYEAYIKALPKDGSTEASTLYVEPEGIQTLAIDADNGYLYWLTSPNDFGEFRRAPVDFSSEPERFEGMGWENIHMAVDSENLYWTNENTDALLLYKRALSGSGPMNVDISNPFSNAKNLI